MNQTLPTKTLIPHSFGHFSAALFVNSFKNQFSLTRNLFFLILLFGIVPNLMYSQGATCGTATSVAINGACLNGTISNTVTSGPASTCGGVVREGWYTFTVTGGPLTINIQATADRNLAFQLLSSTSACTGLAVNACINAVGDQVAAFGTESFTGTLPNGIYYIKILNVGSATNMILQSLCVKSCTVISNNSVTYSNGTSGLLNATAAENGNAVLSAPPAGAYFATVNFASYGTPAGTAPNFTYGTCHATTSQSVTESYVLGSALSTSVPATNTVFGDPCSGTVKRLNIVASYAQPVCSGGTVNIAGTTPTGGNGTYTYAWESSTTSATTGFGAAAGTNNGVSYTSGPITQNTWLRRIVSSCNSTSTSAVVLVKVNPKPTITNVSTATTCSGTSPNIILTSSVPSSFAWTVGTITGSITGANAGNGTAINQVLTNPSNSASGSVQYIVTPTATTGGCIGSPFTITVTVNPKPAVTNATTAATCSGASPNIVLTSSSPSSFAWTLGTITGSVTGASAGNGTAINQVLTNPSNSASGSVQYIVTPTATTGGCIGSPLTITVTVNPTPSATTVSGGGTFCGSTTITASGGTGGTIYFQGTTSGGTSTAIVSSSQTVSTSGTYYFRSRSAEGCWGTEGSAIIVITPGVTAIAGTPNPTNGAAKICYAGVGSITAISWNSVSNATSYDVYFGASALPGSVTSNVTGTSYTTGNLLPNTTYYWKIVPRNSCGITTGTPVTWSFTTSAAPCYCAPAVTNPNDLYMNKFQFVGTLNDNASPNISGASAYSDFTSMTSVVTQPQGAVLNIVASALGSTGQPASGYWKAWVDYNGNGIYETAEQVYSLTAFSTESLTFGFVIPASTPIGKYRFRLRVGEVNTFDACNTVSRGETEDYLFEVVADCAAKINTSTLKDVQRCGTGTVTLTANGSGTGIRWYAAASGGTPLYDGANFITPVIAENTRTTYYVVAYSGTCESVFRIPVTAIANQGPTVNFGAVPSFCTPTTTGQIVSANNGVRLDVLLNEPFDSGLGAFQQNTTESGYLNLPNTYWINRPSPYIPPSPPYEGLAPALSSGYTGGNFAMSNTDFNRAGQLLNRITLANNLDTRNFNNLKLDFDLYYFTLITADTDPTLINYFSVDYTLDGGSATPTWINLQTINVNKGNPNIWEKISINLPSNVLNLTTVKIRFSSFSYGKSGSFKESIAAIDNVKISGIKDENSQFSWTSPLGGILFESDCTTPLDATKASSICVKPSGTQFESNATFSITASASFSSGCPATGTIVIANDLKVFDTTSSSVWNNAPNWKPSAAVPTADKCVVIKKPVNLVSGDGFAKNIIIAPGGSLNIKKDRTLTVTDYIKNETTPLASNEANFVLETDANLIQLNSSTANSGRMTAQRNVTGLRYSPGSAVDYVYWSSPVTGQKTKGAGGFSPGTPNNRFFQYRESNDRFYETADLTFTPGKGYAVQAESNVGSAPTDRLFEFKGAPNNGDIGIGLLKSPNGADGTVHGYNLVGNPYPSNINFEQLHFGNSDLIWGSAWFWTNNIYTASQMGSGYTGNNYAIWNGAGGVAATSPYNGGKIPNGIVKVGQAFIVQAKSAGNLNFKNKYDDTHVLRVNTSGDFYSKNTQPKNRFWINLRSPSQLTNSQLIAYVAGATDEYEQDYDAEAFGNFSDAFYSILPGKKLLIQGRNEAFSNEDEVPVGANFFQNGSYTIALEKGEGIFETNQNIYLKDKQEGIITNLTQGSYTFTAIKADNASRFEIIYQPEAVLATGGSVKEQITVYRDATDFVIKSPKTISTVEVYDSSGKLVVVLKPNGTNAILDASSMPNVGYILKIKTKDGEVTSRKIVR